MGDCGKLVSSRMPSVPYSTRPSGRLCWVTHISNQEGLDFHWYCHEQHEGRVHRYHGHAIRKNIAQKVGARAIDEARASLARAEHITPWELARRFVDDEFAADGGPVPHWVFAEGDARIQRQSPVLPLSRGMRTRWLRSGGHWPCIAWSSGKHDWMTCWSSSCAVPDDRRDDLAATLTIDLSPPS